MNNSNPQTQDKPQPQLFPPEQERSAGVPDVPAPEPTQPSLSDNEPDEDPWRLWHYFPFL